jgi:hypothetical protein
MRPFPVELPGTMIKSPLSRREFAQLAAAGAAGVLINLSPEARAANAATQPLPPIDVNEGDALAAAVPLNVGYTLSDTQSREVALALSGYPGPFAAARAYAIPDTITPAWLTTMPAPPQKKGKSKWRI